VRIGYGKLGRSLTLDPAKYGPQGDAEAPQLLERLARRNPNVEFVIVGKHASKVDLSTLPPNVSSPWTPGIPRAAWNAKGSSYFCSFCRATITQPGVCCEKSAAVMADEQNVESIIVILHVGQHGTTNTFIPQTKNTWTENVFTRPQVWAMNYAGFLVRGMNRLGDRTNGQAPVSLICTDPRNYLKARDVKWPTGYNDILAQHRFVRTGKHERYRDPRGPEMFGFDAKPDRNGELWVANHTYRQSDLELMILPDDWETWGQRDFNDREPLGVASTSGYVKQDEWRRSMLIRRYVLDYWPDTPVFGRWDAQSLKDLPPGSQVQSNSVAQFPELLGSWRVTLSLPATSRSQDGIEWTVAKPYQCFAANVVCFLVGSMDKQGWILPSRYRTEGANEVAPGLWSVRIGWDDESIHLAQWLRVTTPEEFGKRAYAAATSEETWRWLVGAQRRLLTERWDAKMLENTLEYQQRLKGLEDLWTGTSNH
jgi:hypothetical protein